MQPRCRVLGHGTRGGRQAEPERPLGFGLSPHWRAEAGLGPRWGLKGDGGDRPLCVRGSGLGLPTHHQAGWGSPDRRGLGLQKDE